MHTMSLFLCFGYSHNYVCIRTIDTMSFANFITAKSSREMMYDVCMYKSGGSTSSSLASPPHSSSGVVVVHKTRIPYSERLIAFFKCPEICVGGGGGRGGEKLPSV